jgi:hypothetical protein
MNYLGIELTSSFARSLLSIEADAIVSFYTQARALGLIAGSELRAVRANAILHV